MGLKRMHRRLPQHTQQTHRHTDTQKRPPKGADTHRPVCTVRLAVTGSCVVRTYRSAIPSNILVFIICSFPLSSRPSMKFLASDKALQLNHIFCSHSWRLPPVGCVPPCSLVHSNSFGAASVHGTLYLGKYMDIHIIYTSCEMLRVELFAISSLWRKTTLYILRGPLLRLKHPRPTQPDPTLLYSSSRLRPLPSGEVGAAWLVCIRRVPAHVVYSTARFLMISLPEDVYTRYIPSVSFGSGYIHFKVVAYGTLA